MIRCSFFVYLFYFVRNNHVPPLFNDHDSQIFGESKFIAFSSALAWSIFLPIPAIKFINMPDISE